LEPCGQHQNASVAARQRQTQTQHHRSAHGPGHAVDVGAVIGQSRNIARSAGQAGDEQKS